MKREQVKEMAVQMVKEAGLINLSRRQLCARAGVPDGSFPHVMGCTFAQFVEELKAGGVESGAFPVNKTRADPALRKEHILRAAVEMARSVGYNKITRDAVAEAAGVSMGLVTRYFGTMAGLRRDIIRYAIRHEIAEIIAQGMAAGDAHAKKAPDQLRERAREILTRSY